MMNQARCRCDSAIPQDAGREFSSDDADRWESETQAVMEQVYGLLVGHFGLRCDSVDEGCPNCRRWKAFHELFANPYED